MTAPADPADPPKRGRPIGSGEDRTDRVSLTMTHVGKASLRAAARRAGMSMSAWVEQMARWATRQS
jgi:hypothetical protein